MAAVSGKVLSAPLFCLCFPKVLSLLVSLGLFHVASVLQISGDSVDPFFLRALK